MRQPKKEGSFVFIKDLAGKVVHGLFSPQFRNLGNATLGVGFILLLHPYMPDSRYSATALGLSTVLYNVEVTIHEKKLGEKKAEKHRDTSDLVAAQPYAVGCFVLIQKKNSKQFLRCKVMVATTDYIDVMPDHPCSEANGQSPWGIKKKEGLFIQFIFKENKFINRENLYTFIGELNGDNGRRGYLGLLRLFL